MVRWVGWVNGRMAWMGWVDKEVQADEIKRFEVGLEGWVGW